MYLCVTGSQNSETLRHSGQVAVSPFSHLLPMHPLEKKVIFKKPTLGKIFFKRSLLCDYLICLFEMPSSQAHSKLTCVWRVLTWAAPLAAQVLALLDICEQVVVRRYPREAVPFKVCFLNHKWALDLEEKNHRSQKDLAVQWTNRLILLEAISTRCKVIETTENDTHWTNKPIKPVRHYV